MPSIQLTFTNNNHFGVVLYTVAPSSAQQSWQGEVAPHTSSSFNLDIPASTEWQMISSDSGTLFDTYHTTADALQSYSIRNCTTQINFINNTTSTVALFSVDPVSLKESPEGSIAPGQSMIIERAMFGNTEWRMKDAQTGAALATYHTTTARYQTVPINPVVVVITHGETIISGPLPANPTVNPIPLPNNTPIVASAKDSIFNSRSFNIDVVNLDFSIRQRAGLADKNQIRAAVYAALMVIAKTQNRTPKEHFLMDWLALQVRQTRIEAARLALEEYDKWHRDPWSYHPPAGYDFPAYNLMPATSHVWLTTTPNPPVLANESWQSLLAGVISSNPWSPLNNPILTRGQRSSSLEGVVGFPVFGAILAYQKLYSKDGAARILADVTENLSTMNFDLAPLSGAFTTVGAANWYSHLNAIRSMAMQQISPYTFRQVKDIVGELARRAGRNVSGMGTTATPGQLAKIPEAELRATLQRLTSGEILSSLVCTLVLTFAVQALIHESLNLDYKLKLRGKLVENLQRQQSANLPDLQNLLYYDLRGEVVIFSSDYHPTDQAELERIMGSQEVYRAFLLATIE